MNQIVRSGVRACAVSAVLPTVRRSYSGCCIFTPRIFP